MLRKICTFCFVVLISGVGGADMGPRMSDAALFDALNLDFPGLEAVKAAVAQNDVSAAKSAFAGYLRTREKPVWRRMDWFRGDAERARRRAEAVLDWEFRVVGVTHAFGKENEIDWFYNATGGDTGIPFNPEWTWQFNRHSAWSVLAGAYGATNDEVYAKEFADELGGWIVSCPRPLDRSGNETGSAWRTIETGIRMNGSGPTAFFAFRNSPSVPDDLLVEMVKLFAEHALHLFPEKQFRAKSNWGTMESQGLFNVGVLFPEFKDAQAWRDTAGQRLYQMLDAQVYPDGMQIELTTGYHQVSLRNLQAPYELAKLNDVALPQDYLDKLERMFDFDLYAAMPNGRLPALNDGSRTNVRRYLRDGYELFPSRTDFQWLATDGESGTRPAHNSYAFPYAGYMVMRSGWDVNDLYMLLDVGPYGQGHQHEDKLNLVTYAYGRQHVVDPGNYNYDRSAWRSFIKTSFAHNTVNVDGQGQHRNGLRQTYVVEKPMPHTWISKTDYDFAAGIYDDGYGKDRKQIATHQRRVLFVKPADGLDGYWVVSDLLAPSDSASHHYETLFHLDVPADSIAVDDKTQRVITMVPGSSNMAILPIASSQVSVQVLAAQDEPMRGWQRGSDPKQADPLPVASFVMQSKGTARAIYVLYPVRAGQDLPVKAVNVQAVDGAGVGAVVTFSSGEQHSVAFADQAGSAEGFKGLATWSAMDGKGKVQKRFEVKEGM